MGGEPDSKIKLAVMQPYFLPYIGYFQLIKAVDKFVVFDDVTFIKKGWINRNKILINNRENYFTIPLKKSSQSSLIKDVEIHKEQYEAWKGKFLRTIQLSYRRAPLYDKIFPLLTRLLQTTSLNISSVALESLRVVCNYLDIGTTFIESSYMYGNNHLRGQDRIVDICRKENARTYVNLPGGICLYSTEVFSKEGIGLQFIKPGPIIYKQFAKPFVPWLSILDVIMFNPPEETNELLNLYELK